MNKSALVISFDLFREGEADVSYAVASLMSYLKKDNRYGNEFTVKNLSINMLSHPNELTDNYLNSILLEHLIWNFDTIAISCYVWNEYLINPLIKKIFALGFHGKIVLGGYQISYGTKEKLSKEYPQADIFIFGYAEKSLLDSIFLKTSNLPIYLNENVDFFDLPSPYLSNEIIVSKNQKMVRMETKRGCPYKCSFCSHRDLTKNKVHKHNKNKVFEELDFFKEKQVQKINILDPVFNGGKDCLDYLKYMCEIGLKSEITMQTRFEMIKGELGKSFLDLSEKLHSKLEFGVQTVISKEYNAIRRPNDLNIIKNLLLELKNRNISYEVSLIYGLPYQTYDSFMKSVDFFLLNGCKNLTAFPLMLLKGTELYQQKEEFNFVEEEIGDFKIPTVISSNSFTNKEWIKMDNVAKQLNPNQRL